MANPFHDRIKETSTTTGNGNLTLAGAVAQFVAFTTRYAANERFPYAIVGQTGTEWETGVGYLSDATTLVRETIVQSSNSDAVVTLSAGTKDVFVSGSAYALNGNLALMLLANYAYNGGL